jgi:peptidoglycan/xylan/chitin deacetylase (PgdA/CDA1 family)
LLDSHAFDENWREHACVELLIRLYRVRVRIRYASAAIAYELWDKTAEALIAEEKDFASTEVKLAKIYPEYRSRSSIALWNSDRIYKRVARRIAGLISLSIEPALKLASAVIQPFQRAAFFRRIAQRLLRVRIEAASSRAAVDAAGSWAQLHTLFLQRVPVLLYHNVISDTETSANRFTMTQSVFERQIRWLSEGGYKGIRVSDYLAWRESNVPLPPKPVLITFDDAYDDGARHAFPVLEKFGFPAACMVVTGEIGKINRWDFVRGEKALQLMDATALVEWGRRGIEYGAHSCSHPDLRTLSEGELQDELAGSRQELEQVTGLPVRTFAYPYGFFDRRVRDQTASVYDFAFTTVPRPSDLATDPLQIGRMEPLPSDTRFDLFSRVRWGWSARLRAKAKISRTLGISGRSLSGMKSKRDLAAAEKPHS